MVFRILCVFVLMFASLMACQKESDECKGGIHVVKIDQYQFTSLYETKDYINFYSLDADSVPINQGDTIYLNFRMSYKTVMTKGSGNTLMACVTPKEEITDLGDSLRIESIYPFNLNHPVDSDVSEFFFIFNEKYKYQSNVLPYLPLNQFNINNERFNFLMLGLIKKPESDQAKFRLIIHDRKTKLEYIFETPDLIYK